MDPSNSSWGPCHGQKCMERNYREGDYRKEGWIYLRQDVPQWNTHMRQTPPSLYDTFDGWRPHFEANILFFICFFFFFANWESNYFKPELFAWQSDGKAGFSTHPVLQQCTHASSPNLHSFKQAGMHFIFLFHFSHEEFHSIQANRAIYSINLVYK